MKGFLIITLLLSGINCYATKYYVKNGGSDSNSGLNDKNAWAHHPWMEGWEGNSILKPGDVVHMKRGDNWRIANPEKHFILVEQSGTKNKPITTTAYDKGPAPIIGIITATDKSVIKADGKSHLVFSNLHIQHHSKSYAVQRNGIYLDGDPNPCHDIVICNCKIEDIPYVGVFGYKNCYNIIIGDTTVVYIASKENHSNHILNFGYAGISLQGCNPEDSISNNYVYHNYIHDAAGEFINEYGVTFTSKSSSAYWPRYAYACFNRVENINAWEAIECHGGSFLYFNDNYIRNFGKAGIWVGGDNRLAPLPAISDNLFIERNIIEQPSLIEGDGSFILQSSNDDKVIPSNIYIRDNVCFFSERPIEGRYNGIRCGNVDGLTISGNTIYNGALNSGSGGIVLTHNFSENGYVNVEITRNFISQWGPGISLDAEYMKGRTELSRNIIVLPSKTSCIRLIGGDIPPEGQLLMYHNDFLMDSTYDRCFHSSFGISSGGSVIVNNNIIGWLTSDQGVGWVWQGDLNGTFQCDYNIYWNSMHEGHSMVNGILYNWSEWNTLGFDLNSHIDTDPLYKNGSSSYLKGLDFVLEKYSPAIDMGKDVGQLMDFLGDDIIGLPDIGAMELGRVESIAKEKEIKLFPNPVMRNISVRIDEPTLIHGYVRVLDMSGRIILYERINQCLKVLQLPIDLPHGLYVFQIGSDQQLFHSEKIVVL